MSNDSPEIDVLVIGAGFAGLTAARDLAASGLRVTVIEGRDRIGGRTWCRRYAGTEKSIEIGGTWFSTEWMHALRAEIDRYGIELMDQPAPQNFVWATGGQTRAHAPIPAEDLGAAEKAIAELHLAMRRTPGGRLLSGEDYSDLDVPITEWPPFAALPDASHEFVLAFASMYGGCAPENVSVLHYTRMMAEFGDSAAALYDGLAQKFAHGTVSLAEALYDDFGGQILLSTRVLAVTATDTDGEPGVTVTTDRGDFTARRVISTVPINALHRIRFEPELPSAVRAASEAGHSCMSIKSWSRCRNVPDGLFGLGWGGPVQWVSNEYPLGDGTTLVCAFGYDPEALDASSPESVQSALRRYAPDIEVLSVDTHDWAGDEFSDGAWSIWAPRWVVDGHESAFDEPHGRVYFAGSDVAKSWPGWIDGAIFSGAATAARVRESLAE